MANYLITNKALDDLTEIWNYTYDEWSENQADKYYLLLLNSFQELAENPKKGKKYEIVNPHLLGYKSGKHIIFYRIISDATIEITRILQGRMDLKNKI